MHNGDLARHGSACFGKESEARTEMNLETRFDVRESDQYFKS